MHHLFISDVHYGAFDEQKQDQLENDIINLIDYCEKHSIKLHVLGDLFDYWMEFPNYIPSLGYNILARFETYHKKIGSTHFITGNHDFWTIDYFKKTGFEVWKNSKKISLGNKSVFLMHGDGLADKTFGMERPILNRMLRHPWFVSLYRSVFAADTANNIMKRFSEFTRDPKSESPKKLNKWAGKLISEHGEDVVISGHDHIARTETFPDGLYINTGAFHKDYTLAEYKNGLFQLVTWNSYQKNLLPYKRI